MGFQDLPKNIRDLPLHEPRLVADVLDLVVSEADRRAGALAILICDEQDRLRQPAIITDGLAIPVEERHRVLVPFAMALEEAGVPGSLIVAIARRDGLSITAEDVAWATVLRRTCPPTVRLLGVHVITLAGSREIPAGAAAA